MKKYIDYFLVSVFVLFGCTMTSCDDDETTLSRAVLASIDVLEFNAEPAGPQIITVTSDADWVSDAPEWVTITPTSGHAGQTEVEIIATSNKDERGLNNPRKATIQFKGRNLESIATVVIRQDGDKFRDPVDYTIESLSAIEDETVVRLPNLIVVALSRNGFIATDGDSYAYVSKPSTPVAVGQKVSVVGEKFTDSMKMSYVKGDRITNEGSGDVPSVDPVDITGTLDSTNGIKYQFVTLTGTYDGSSVTVENMTCKVYLIDDAEDLNLESVKSHKISVTGFYAGMATPVVNIIPVKIDDLGLNEVVYWEEDFEWLEPWSVESSAADIVGTDQADTTQPQISDKKKYSGSTPEEELTARGYEFIRDCASSKKPGECIYIQRNYLKFGKTGYQGGIILPAMPKLENGVDGLTLAFDWYPQRQGEGVMDPTELVVLVQTGEDINTYAVPEHGLVNNSKAQWVHARIEMAGAKLTKDTRITIRNADSQMKSGKALRWHLDNVRVSKPM